MRNFDWVSRSNDVFIEFQHVSFQTTEMHFFNHSFMNFGTWRFAGRRKFTGNSEMFPTCLVNIVYWVNSFERLVRVVWNMWRLLLHGNSLSRNQMLKLDQSTDSWKNSDLPQKCAHIFNTLICDKQCDATCCAYVASGSIPVAQTIIILSIERVWNYIGLWSAVHSSL